MSVTAADIRAEHEAAMASLTVIQRRALERENHATRLATFVISTQQIRLEEIYEIEARARNEGRPPPRLVPR